MDEVVCFIINLKKDKEKKEHMLSVARKNKINPVFIDAVYGLDLKKNTILECYSEKKTKENIGHSLTKGEVGCALSHLSIYKRMLASNIPLALVLEDDVDFNYSYDDLRFLVKKLPSDWECILLGHHSKYSREQEGIASFWGRLKVGKGYNVVRFVDRTAGGYGYVINQNGARKWLREYELITKPIDRWESGKINLYGISPPIIKVLPKYNIGSTIDIERVKKTKTIKHPKNIKSITRSLLKFLGLLELVFFLKNLWLKSKFLKIYC